MKLCSAPRLSKACAWVAVVLWPGVAIGSCHTGEKPFHVVLKSLRIYPDAVTAPSRAASTGRPPHRLPPAFSTKLPEPPWIRARPHRTRPGLAGELGGGGHAKPGAEASEQRRGLHSPRSRWRRQQHFPEWFLKTVVGVFPSYLLGFNKQRQVKASSFSWHI